MILAPLCLMILWKGGMALRSFIVLWLALAFYEWGRLVQKSSFSISSKILWALGGFSYMGYAFWTFWILAGHPLGNTFLGILLLLVWTNDTGGYLCGKVFQGPKLAPKISPHKTWSGALGSVLLTWFVTYMLGIKLWEDMAYQFFKSVSVALGVSFVAQLGDLGESWVKRRFGVKDTGVLIPGHGGVIDRLDSLLAVGFVLGVLMAVCPWLLYTLYS